MTALAIEFPVLIETEEGTEFVFDFPEYCALCGEAESGGGCVCDPVDPEEEA